MLALQSYLSVQRLQQLTSWGSHWNTQVLLGPLLTHYERPEEGYLFTVGEVCSWGDFPSNSWWSWAVVFMYWERYALRSYSALLPHILGFLSVGKDLMSDHVLFPGQFSRCLLRLHTVDWYLRRPFEATSSTCVCGTKMWAMNWKARKRFASNEILLKLSSICIPAGFSFFPCFWFLSALINTL